MKIFWSWQSDTHQPSGRYFVRDVLTSLAKDLNGIDGAEEAERPSRDEEDNSQDDGRVVIDHDTLGVGGSPRIADTILRKIRDAAVFVADVTPVGNTPGGKKLPNPNVMIELGYALRVIGLERIVLVMNRAEGAALKSLPFDLRHWRAPVTYSLARDAIDERMAEVARQLKEDLRVVIEPGLKTAAEAFSEEKRRVQRAPHLAVGLAADKEGPFQISQMLQDLDLPSLEEIRRKTPLLTIPKTAARWFGGPTLPSRIHTGSRLARMPWQKPVDEWTREEKEDFNRRVERYYGRYQTYIEAVAEHTLLAMRSISVSLILENTGTLPATGMDVEITFPEGVVLHDDEGGFPDQPKAPEPPPLAIPGVAVLQNNPSLSIPYPLPIRSTSYYPVDRRVESHVDHLKHHRQTSLEEFVVSFATRQDIRSFEAEYVITANETLDPIRGTIAFSIEHVE